MDSLSIAVNHSDLLSILFVVSSSVQYCSTSLLLFPYCSSLLFPLRTPQISFQPLVQALDIDNILTLFTAVLLEKKILLRASRQGAALPAGHAACFAGRQLGKAALCAGVATGILFGICLCWACMNSLVNEPLADVLSTRVPLMLLLWLALCRYELLTLIAETVSHLIYPFKWAVSLLVFKRIRLNCFLVSLAPLGILSKGTCVDPLSRCQGQHAHTPVLSLSKLELVEMS